MTAVTGRADSPADGARVLLASAGAVTERAQRRPGPRLPSRYKWALGGMLCLALVLGGALPPQLGGATSYVITRGASMLPNFHTGDLVIVRKESSYHLGEVAAYHNGDLHTVVMHRIVAVNGNHFVFKGDNNNFIDTFQPTQAQMVGAEWLHLPGVGHYVQDLRNPAVAAVLLAVLWIYSFSPGSKSRRCRRRHRHVR